MSRPSNRYRPMIVGGTFLLPLVVAIIYFGPKWKVEGIDLSILPAINACVNAGTAILLIVGRIAIAKGQRDLHRRLMQSALLLAIIFLLLYILYHISNDNTHYGGVSPWNYVYYFLLITHIILAAVMVPLVLITWARALSGNFDRHKPIARWTFPVWLYVSISGVLVYLMIAPYYQ